MTFVVVMVPYLIPVLLLLVARTGNGYIFPSDHAVAIRHEEDLSRFHGQQTRGRRRRQRQVPQVSRASPSSSSSSSSWIEMSSSQSSAGGGTTDIDDAVASDSVATNDNDNDNNQCPFATVIPRYRIDLSSTSKMKKRRRIERQSKNNGRRSSGDPSSSSSSFFFNMIQIPSSTPPWQKFFQRQQLQQMKQRIKKDGQEVKILVGVDGIEAISCLWRSLTELMIDVGVEIDDSDEGSSIVLALPDSSVDLLLNFVEIVEWMSENVLRLDEGYISKSSQRFGKIHAEIIEGKEKSSIPVIKLTRTLRPSRQVAGTALPASTIDADVINERTRHWVRRLLVDEKICPFTRSDRMSGQGLGDLGVPVGSIAYHASHATHPVQLFADTWTAIHGMIQAGPEGKTGVSSILLAAPYYDDDFDLWAGPIFAILEASVVAAGAENDIGVVCFHPRYATPDGSTFPGFGHMHSVPRLAKWWEGYVNSDPKATDTPEEDKKKLDTDEIAAGGAWQRRTPHATINVLRADQLAVAESRRQSEVLYPKNIERLVIDIGSDQLAIDLEKERQMGSESHSV